LATARFSISRSSGVTYSIAIRAKRDSRLGLRFHRNIVHQQAPCSFTLCVASMKELAWCRQSFKILIEVRVGDFAKIAPFERIDTPLDLHAQGLQPERNFSPSHRQFDTVRHDSAIAFSKARARLPRTCRKLG